MGQGSSKYVPVKVKSASFLRNKGELSALLKSLSRVSEEAVAILVAAMSATEGVDQKTRIACAEKLIDFQISCAKQVNDDNMQRMIAEIKLNKQPLDGNLTTIEYEERNNRPIVDFSNIQEID